MKTFFLILLSAFSLTFQSIYAVKIADPSDYLNDIKLELKKEWPKNRTINLVFHGHSVPTGYFKTPVVNTLESYPFQLLKLVKPIYPYSVINIITTSIGGENSKSGAKRFEEDVLTHKPDVLFIDYALNDRYIGKEKSLEKAKEAWEQMIEMALKKGIKVILMTPSPDEDVNILQVDTDLEKHSLQIKSLANKYGVGLVDSYELFRQKVISGENLSNYMSQVNHPNEKGNFLIANGILEYFK